MNVLPGETDFIVVGAGIAGLRASVELASAGRVLCLAKREVTESNTQYAQGGIAAALSDDDEVSLHLDDTLKAGDGLCNEEAARILVEEGPARIEELIEWGTEFDRTGSKIAFTREGAHSRNRVLHAHGDSTGREIGRALYLKAQAMKPIVFREFEFTTDLVVRDGRVVGVQVLDDQGHLHEVRASSVLLATGGLGQVYSDTTNPAVATGDGVAMAYRAGAEISDMEFVQFHPTALFLKGAPRFLLSEALRGEGAYLRNLELQRFMHKYHEMGELAPRDVVARAIAHELEITKSPDAAVYLDLTHLNADKVRKRFPTIYATCMQYNIDIAEELVPIRPAAHYAMGGVRTDLDGSYFPSWPLRCRRGRLHRRSWRESAGQQFPARRTGLRCARGPHDAETNYARLKSLRRNSNRFRPNGMAAPPRLRNSSRKSRRRCGNMSPSCVMARRYRETLAELNSIGSAAPKPTDRRAHEAANILQTGTLITRSAIAREESRGAHYRLDFPLKNDRKFDKHSVIEGDAIRFE